MPALATSTVTSPRTSRVDRYAAASALGSGDVGDGRVLISGAFCLGKLHIPDGDARAKLSEPASRRQSDTPAAAGNNDRLTFQLETHRLRLPAFLA